MKTIKYNGQEVEAYSLIMTKANALDILNGKKVIEARKLSSKYERCLQISSNLKKTRD